MSTTVTAIETSGGRTVLQTGSASTLVLDGSPDVEAAKRRLLSVRRVSQVDVTVTSTGATAVMRGTSSRLPFASAIPLPVALGLTELGVRTTIRSGRG